MNWKLIIPLSMFGLAMGIATVFVPGARAQAAFITAISVDPDNAIRITHSDGKVVRPPKEKDQGSCEDPAVAEDKQTAGWLVAYGEHPSTSYPIPTTLIIYRSGKILRRLGNGFVFGSWFFVNGGKQVAFNTDTLHGSLAPYYELRDIETNKIIDKWQAPLSDKSPEWVKRLFN